MSDTSTNPYGDFGFVDPTALLAALMGQSQGKTESALMTDAAKRLNLFQDLQSINPKETDPYVPNIMPDFQPTPSAARAKYKDQYSQAAMNEVDAGSKSSADVESQFFNFDPTTGNKVLKPEIQLDDGTTVANPLTFAQADRVVNAAKDREGEMAKEVTDKATYDREKAKNDAQESAKQQAAQEKDPYGYVTDLKNPPTADSIMSSLAAMEAPKQDPHMEMRPTAPVIPAQNVLPAAQALGGGVGGLDVQQHILTPARGHVNPGYAPPMANVQINPQGKRTVPQIQQGADLVMKNLAPIIQRAQQNSTRPSQANADRQQRTAGLIQMLLGGS